MIYLLLSFAFFFQYKGLFIYEKCYFHEKKQIRGPYHENFQSEIASFNKRRDCKEEGAEESSIGANFGRKARGPPASSNGE